MPQDNLNQALKSIHTILGDAALIDAEMARLLVGDGRVRERETQQIHVAKFIAEAFLQRDEDGGGSHGIRSWRWNNGGGRDEKRQRRE